MIGMRALLYLRVFPLLFFIKEIKENVHMVKKKKIDTEVYSMRIDDPPNLVLWLFSSFLYTVS